MRSYVKIYGPPILEAIRKLEELAVGMPEVCIMDCVIARDLSPQMTKELGGTKVQPETGAIAGFFMETSGIAIPVKRCHSIISKHGQKLGEYDFFFEWYAQPDSSQLNDLIRRIDDALKPLGCLYTITTK